MLMGFWSTSLASFVQHRFDRELEMYGFRERLFLFAFLLLAAVSYAANHHPDHGAEWMVNSLAQGIADADEAHRKALEVERLLRIPQGHLRPVYQYHHTQNSIIIRHLQNPNSRYMQIRGRLGQSGSIFATAWTVMRPDTRVPTRGVFFFRVDPPGIASPMFHSGFKEENLPNRDHDLWQYLNEHATLTNTDLAGAFPRLRNVGM